MKKVLRSSQVLTIVLVTLALSSVFLGVESAWATDQPERLSMSTVEDVNILGSGTGLVKLSLNVSASPLADMYRELLAAPPDAGVGEAMPIPENETENGGVTPVRQDYYRSVKQEQMISFGFGMRILNSSMVPRDEQNGCKVSIDALASPQVVSITDLGSDVVFEVVVGPKDENATGAAFGHVVTKVAFAQDMLDSVEGEQVYEVEWTTRIKLPAEATLLNGDEFDGLSWVVNFGAGTSMNAFVALDEPSTIVLSERTVVTEQNVTATLAEIFEAFRGYKVFKIRYQLPESALAEGEGLWESAIDRDWSFSWNWQLPLEFQIPFEYTFPGGYIRATLTITVTFSFSGYIGFDIDWVPWPELDWFKAWISVGAQLRVTLDAEVHVGGEYTWERTLYRKTLYRFAFAIGPVPVWADLDFSIITRFTVGAEATVNFWVEAMAGASLKAGVKYDNGWSPIWEPNLYAHLNGPTIDVFANAHAEAYLAGRLSLMIYSVAGPFIEFGPYVRGDITYLQLEEIAVWKVKTGLKVNVGITFCDFLKDLLGLRDYYKTIGDWPIKTWEGHWGQARSYISINLEPDSTYIGSATMVSGVISSPYAGNKGGTVFIEYSTDDVNWIPVPAGSVQSSASGEYSFFWVLLEAGDFYLRSRWDGNSGYKGASSTSVPLTVSSVVSGSQYIPPYYEELSFPGWDVNNAFKAAAVRFTPPTPFWKLDKFSIYGMRVGADDGPVPPKNVYIRVWDSDLNDLWQGDYRMSECFPQDAGGWKEIDIEPDLLVSGDFYIVVWGDSYVYPELCYIKIGEDGTFPFSGHGAVANTFYNNSITHVGGSDWGILASGYSLVEDHYMCWERWYYIYDEWTLVRFPTTTFYIDEDSACSWVNFRATGSNDVRWEWWGPTGLLRARSYITPPDWNGEAIDALKIEDNRWYFEQYHAFGVPLTVDIYFNGMFAFTETFRVIKHVSSLSLTLSSDSITYGQSVQISSQLSPIGFSDGTIILQFSSDEVRWHYMVQGTPQTGEWGPYSWVPSHAGTYYLRANWSGNENWATSTSETVTLTVNKAPTSLSTSLSSTTMTVGPDVTITPTLTSAITGAPLQGKSVAIQFSNDGSTWYTLGANTTDSAGQCTYTWAPDVEVYYIRSTWYGDDDYLGTNGTSVELTVEPKVSTIVEIVSGADSEVDRNPEGTVEFKVRVKDAETEEYLRSTGRVEFYVSDQSYYHSILIGSDNDTDGDGIYQMQWTVNDSWPVLGPQPWGAFFTGTPEYMPNSTSSTFTIYYYGVASWIDPTYQEVNVTSTETYTINFKWNRDTTDTFDLSLTGLDPTWYTLSQTSLTFDTKGQTEQVILTISPPNAPTILTNYEFAVTATSQEDPSFYVSATATLRVRFTPTPPATPTGSLAIAVQPNPTIYMSTGTTTSINILVVNNQNFDDVITIDIRNLGIQPQYQANLTWFNWITAKVFLPAGASINVPLEINLPADTLLGIYDFRAVATSTSDFAITTEDSVTINAADITPPTTTITLTGTLGLNGWYVSDVTVTLTATDDLSGVASTEYSFDGINWIPYTDPFTITTEGTTTIYYRSIDNAGNVATNTATIILDKTPPTTTLTIGEPKYVDSMGNIYVSSATPFTLTAEDNPDGTGVASTFYRISNDTYETGWLDYSEPFYLAGLSDGEYVTEYYSIDTIGNTEMTNSTSVTLDNTPPNITILSPVNGRWYRGNEVPLNFTVDETTSWIGYSLDGEENITITGNIVLANLPYGYHNVTLYANDTCNNMGTSESVHFTVTGLCDLNCDGGVGMEDIAIASRAYGSHPGHSRWNPIVDINQDEKVDLIDISFIARNFGEKYT